MTSTTLLTTKLYIPHALPAFVPRPRITERLSVGMAGKLTLITAPAGFGKTTAATAWLHPQAEAHAGHAFVLHPDRVVWVSLDQADNDSINFWAYVLTALEGLVPEIGAIRLSLDAVPPPPIEAVLTTLINGLSQLSHQIVIVLDDYHFIVAPQIHQAVQFLLDHLPAHLHLLILSRSTPPLLLSRLRARGLLTQIDASDLRFTSDEAAQFLTEVMRLPVSPADIAALEARTEGWITGLHLAALAMRGRSDCAGFIRAFTGSSRFILEYLAEEVLARQPSHVQRFLLHTSILDRMCGSLCDAVLGVDVLKPSNLPSAKPANVQAAYSQLLLAELERNNLFITPLDDEQRWYRYHALFVEALRHRLTNGATPQEVATLHSRASDWFERHGFVSEAVHHALAAEEWDRAIDLIHGLPLAGPVNVNETPAWLEAIPEHLIAAHPMLDRLRNKRLAVSPRSEHTTAANVQGLPEPLTERELEVLRLVAAGTSNRAIAEQLTVTVGTVKKHLNNIFGKLDVQSRTHALARARELGLL